MIYDVDMTWDDEAGVWCAVCDSIPIALECKSYDALLERVKVATLEILELNGKLEDSIHLCFRTVHLESIA